MCWSAGRRMLRDFSFNLLRLCLRGTHGRLWGNRNLRTETRFACESRRRAHNSSFGWCGPERVLWQRQNEKRQVTAAVQKLLALFTCKRGSRQRLATKRVDKLQEQWLGSV